MPQAPRQMITLDPILHARIRETKAYIGNKHAFSKFLVHLIELGLAKLDEETLAELESEELEHQ